MHLAAPLRNNGNARCSKESFAPSVDQFFKGALLSQLCLARLQGVCKETRKGNTKVVGPEKCDCASTPTNVPLRRGRCLKSKERREGTKRNEV